MKPRLFTRVLIASYCFAALLITPLFPIEKKSGMTASIPQRHNVTLEGGELRVINPAEITASKEFFVGTFTFSQNSRGGFEIQLDSKNEGYAKRLGAQITGDADLCQYTYKLRERNVSQLGAENNAGLQVGETYTLTQSPLNNSYIFSSPQRGSIDVSYDIIVEISFQAHLKPGVYTDSIDVSIIGLDKYGNKILAKGK